MKSKKDNTLRRKVYEFKVLEKDAYQIKRVEIRKMEEEQEEEKAATV